MRIKTHLDNTLYLSSLWSDLSCYAELVIAGAPACSCLYLVCFNDKKTKCIFSHGLCCADRFEELRAFSVIIFHWAYNSPTFTFIGFILVNHLPLHRNLYLQDQTLKIFLKDPKYFSLTKTNNLSERQAGLYWSIWEQMLLVQYFSAINYNISQSQWAAQCST